MDKRTLKKFAGSALELRMKVLQMRMDNLIGLFALASAQGRWG
jgi:hypothetical protein